MLIIRNFDQIVIGIPDVHGHQMASGAGTGNRPEQHRHRQRVKMHNDRGQWSPCNKTQIRAAGNRVSGSWVELTAGFVQIYFLITKAKRGALHDRGAIGPSGIGRTETDHLHTKRIGIERTTAFDISDGQDQMVEGLDVNAHATEPGSEKFKKSRNKQHRHQQTESQ